MSRSSWVLVHEYVTGGGWTEPELPAGLAGEAAAMLAALLADFAAWGQVRTLTTLDARLAPCPLPADEVRVVAAGAYRAALQAALARCDAALFIAPETGGVLRGLSEQALAAGVRLLGSSPQAVGLAGDKWACAQRWQAAGVRALPTRRAPAGVAAAVAAQIGYPLVVKPVDGVDCAGVCLVRTPADLGPAVALAGQVAPGQPILLQPYVTGNHASVSLLIAGARILPLSLNGQDVWPGCPFSYHGGCVPLDHPAAGRAFAVAEAAAAALPGLQGFAGVDLILDGAGAWAVEINPRLTTAYIGLRRVANINLAQAIWQAGVEAALPAAVELHGRAVFGKGRDGSAWEVT